MLRIALPNKGSLSEPALEMLAEAGYATRRDTKQLTLTDAVGGVQFFFLRPRDIAVYVGSGKLDAGITGRDLLLDSHVEAREVMSLDFGGSTFRFAARPGTASKLEDVEGLRVATSYPVLVADYLTSRGVSSSVIQLEGAVEVSIELGVADVVADVVETGTTLRAAGLEVFGEPILTSEAVLIGNDSAAKENLTVLQRRLSGVMAAREYVLMDYDIRAELVDAACNITPGIESPTVSDLRDRDWKAVRAMVAKRGTNQVMDELYALGARGILVTTIHACRL